MMLGGREAQGRVSRDKRMTGVSRKCRDGGGEVCRGCRAGRGSLAVV